MSVKGAPTHAEVRAAEAAVAARPRKSNLGAAVLLLAMILLPLMWMR